MTSMQIKAILLYNDEGEIRELSFNPGSVNVITGSSNTGKSTIIQIIHYCLGYPDFEICEGVTRDAVAWYAVLYQVHDMQVLVAKPKPPGNAKKQSQAYYKQAKKVLPPAFSELVPNCDDQKVIRNISKLLGVATSFSEHTDRIKALKVTVDYSHFYLFQEKTVIANNQILFYRQQDYSQIIKETLPYFLGVTEEEYLRAKQELEAAKSALKSARYRLRQEQGRLSTVTDMAKDVISEAQRVGLIDSAVLENKDIVSEVLTRAIKGWEPTVAPPVADDRLPELRDELDELRRQLAQKDEEINSVKSFIREAKGYSQETKEQVMRLESINLFHPHGGLFDSLCPLCHSMLETAPPQVTAMNEALRKLQDDSETENLVLPELGRHLREKEVEKERIKRMIAAKKSVLGTILEEQNENKTAVQQILDANTRIERAIGRIEFYLEMTKPVNVNSTLQRQVEEDEILEKYWMEQVNAHNVESEKQSTLHDIGLQMSEWAKKLKLEHNGFYYLDLDKLSVIVDKHKQSISMQQMGGRSKNWLGCHLITLLALHKHFVEQERPVPNFIVLDQPAQGYYPSRKVYDDITGAPNESLPSGADSEAVERMFDFLFDVCEELSPKFQIIVLEHANLDSPRFRNAIVDGGPWKPERGLIPQSWITE